METPYDIYGYVIIHSFEMAGFEILNIEIPDEYDTPQNEGLMEMFCEDVGDYGNISKQIHKDLWKESQTEQINKVKVCAGYTTTKDYFGEIDIESTFTYEVTERNMKYDNLLVEEGHYEH